jgi:hypothetical protein
MLFAITFAALYAAHVFGDHWVQRHTEATRKGAPGSIGRWACASHVYTLTLTKFAFLLVAYFVVALKGGPPMPSVWLVLAVLTLDALSHYWADRAAGHPDKTRPVTLERLAARLKKADFYHLGKDTVHQFRPSGSHLGTGAYALDQSFHVACLFVAALLIQLFS